MEKTKVELEIHLAVHWAMLRGDHLEIQME
jgi:hypothetical protein